MSIKPLIEWIKNNKLATLVIFLLLFLLLCSDLSSFMGVSYKEEGEFAPGLGGTVETLPEGETPTKGRVVIQESDLSLVVKDVSSTADWIVNYAEKEGGFMVSSTITRPEEVPLGTIVVRVPSKKLKEAIAYFRSLAVKVVEESLQGRDVTEEYADYEARIKTLKATIAQFEAIKERATKISDLVSITNEIINLQEQIDTYKGYLKALNEEATYSKITVYLATDEFALPYQPPAGFRPEVVLKQAVRSLLANLYAVGRALIWIGVYSVIWVPALAVVIFLRKRGKRSSRRSS